MYETKTYPKPPRGTSNYLLLCLYFFLCLLVAITAVAGMLIVSRFSTIYICTIFTGWGRIALLPFWGQKSLLKRDFWKIPFENGFLENPFSPSINTTSGFLWPCFVPEIALFRKIFWPFCPVLETPNVRPHPVFMSCAFMYEFRECRNYRRGTKEKGNLVPHPLLFFSFLSCLVIAMFFTGPNY